MSETMRACMCAWMDWEVYCFMYRSELNGIEDYLENITLSTFFFYICENVKNKMKKKSVVRFVEEELYTGLKENPDSAVIDRGKKISESFK